MEQVVAGVTGESALGEDDEVDALPFGSGHESKSAIGVEGTVRQPEVRGSSGNANETVGVHNGSLHGDG
jgi:hypothetical protein